MTVTEERHLSSWQAGADPSGHVPPVDSELTEPLRSALAQMPMPLTLELVPQRRAGSAAGRLTDEQLSRGGAFTVTEYVVPPDARRAGIPLVICRPTATPGPHPVVYHVHGGGMVAGSPRSGELAGELDRAEELQLAVVSVDYRLAPEHPDPIPVRDCWTGLVWLAEHAHGLGLAPDQILLSGTSAGGALAAGLALMCRDRGSPVPLGQMLHFPMLDDRETSGSVAQLAHTGLWDGASNQAGWSALLGDRLRTGCVSSYAAPARARDLAGLAPAFVEVGAVEALRDQGVAYASRIWQAGGDAELHVWAGAFHCFDEWAPHAVVSGTAHRTRVDWIRRLLERRPGATAPRGTEEAHK